jgi:hypothetical protein
VGIVTTDREKKMTVPYNDDTRETYVQRMKDSHLELARKFSDLPSCTRSMYLQLFYWAMAEDVYGEHWDKLERRNK